jgi:hypothetical protein
VVITVSLLARRRSRSGSDDREDDFSLASGVRRAHPQLPTLAGNFEGRDPPRNVCEVKRATE